VPKRIDKLAKKDAIGNAAMRVFQEAGYHKARMADIALAAGIGKGTVYEYFRDKTEIIRYEFDRYFRAFKEGAIEALGCADTSAGQLQNLVDFSLSHVETWRDHCGVYIDYFSLARTSEGKKVHFLADFYEDMRKLLRELIEKGQMAGDISPDFDATATAQLLISLYDGIVLHDIFDRRGDNGVGIRIEAIRLITRGLFSGDSCTGGR
jgi:AcrR family transcriptional regulator